MSGIDGSEVPSPNGNSSCEKPVSLAPIGPGNYDRAWNDPPMFDPRVNIIGKPPPSKLNKRVAHPISSAAVPQPQPVTGSNFAPNFLPPTSPPTGSAAVPILIPIQNTSSLPPQTGI